MFYLSILMISNIYAESITIYAAQSASYRASGSGSSGCCTLNSIGYNNSNTLSASSCIWWSQYGQCERRTSYPIWSFNFIELPSNAILVSAQFKAEATYDEWNDSYMAISSQIGEISTQMGSYLVSGGDWSIDGQVWTWWNTGLGINQALPISEVGLGIESGQLNIAVHEYLGTIINSGLNAPRLVIEYELLDYECSEMDESACSNDTNCNWIENIETGNCDWLSTSECVSNPECLLDCVTTYDCFGCTGGWYEIDNGFCEEIQALECSEMDEVECSDSSVCDWLVDIEYGNCSNYNNGTTCDANENCFWDLCYGGSYGSWSHCCRGGTYQVENSYCEEIEILECPEMNEIECANDDGCEWVEDIEIGQCSEFDNSESSCTNYPGECYWDEDITYASCNYSNSGSCNSVEGCYWDCSDYGWYCDCYGQQQIVDTECIGQYEINNNYCDELSYIPGDTNDDGSLNISDIVLMVDLILNSDFNEYADMNQDGILNIMDIIELVNRILDI